MAVAGAELVGALRITTDTLRIGEARLKMGGIGWLTTTERFRRKGIASLLMADALAYMQEHSYHVSMLFGIPNFYEKFGYATSLLEHSILVDTAESRSFQNPFKVRAARPTDIPVLQRIHNACDAETACSMLRSSAHLKNRWTRFADWRLLIDDQGKAVAYFYPRIEFGCLSVIEIGHNAPGIFGALLGAAGEIALEHSLPQIRFFVPPSHPFTRFMLRFRSIHETRVENNAGGMMAFVDVMEALESMIPEWESQLERSMLRDARTEITLVTDRKNITIRVNRGAIDIAQRPTRHRITLSPGELMHLVTGYLHLDDLLETKPVLLPAETLALLAAIFPKRSPFVWPYDRF